MVRTTRRFIAAAIAAAACLLALPVAAQSGGRILHIVVPFAAGGVQDILARSISDDLGKALG